MPYELRKNERGEIVACDSCYSEVPTDKFGNDGALCQFCAGTVLGNIIKGDNQLGRLAQGIVQALHIIGKD